MNVRGLTFFFLLLFISIGIRAEALVVGIQMPAWLERDGKQAPLTPGLLLKANDRIITGNQARVLLKMAEGSNLKLGENASLKLDNFNVGRDESSVFRASMSVIKGAFRFTTDALSKFRKRDINVRVATITTGIRGTDFWTKAADDKDIVCLIEGKISVEHDNDPLIIMQDPLAFYVLPKNKPALPVASVSPEKIEEWKSETEIADQQGSVWLGGAWKVNFASPDNQEEANKLLNRLQQAGYPAEIFPVTKNAKAYYRVRIASLPSRLEAEALGQRLKKITQTAQPWVSTY